MANTFTNYYSTKTTYDIDDYTVYGGKLYRALVTNLGASPTLNPSVWTVASNTFVYRSNWQANTTYNIGDTVRYSNVSFVLIGASSNNEIPVVTTNKWKVFNNDYKNIVTYQSGDIQYQGVTLPQRLPIGNNGQVLTISNSFPVWANTFTLPNNLSITGNVSANNFIATRNITAQNVITQNVVATSITATGRVIFSNVSANVITSNTIVANTYNYPNGESVGFTYTLDDISSGFNGIRTTFNLSYNGLSASPINPNQIQIQIGGVQIPPNTKATDYFNLSAEIYTQQNGFVLNGNTITFATAPLNGMNFYGTYKTNLDRMPQFFTYQVPFLPLNIALGT